MTKFPVLPLAPSRNILIALSSGQGIQPWLMGLTEVAYGNLCVRKNVSTMVGPPMPTTHESRKILFGNCLADQSPKSAKVVTRFALTSSVTLTRARELFLNSQCRRDAARPDRAAWAVQRLLAAAATLSATGSASPRPDRTSWRGGSGVLSLRHRAGSLYPLARGCRENLARRKTRAIADQSPLLKPSRQRLRFQRTSTRQQLDYAKTQLLCSQENRRTPTFDGLSHVADPARVRTVADNNSAVTPLDLRSTVADQVF